MAYRIVNEVDAPSSPLTSPNPTLNASSLVQGRKDKDGNGSLSVKSGTGTAGMGANGRKMDEDEERDAVFFRLEMLGYRVGQGLVERFVLLSQFPSSPLLLLS